MKCDNCEDTGFVAVEASFSADGQEIPAQTVKCPVCKVEPRTTIPILPFFTFAWDFISIIFRAVTGFFGISFLFVLLIILVLGLIAFPPIAKVIFVFL